MGSSIPACQGLGRKEGEKNQKPQGAAFVAEISEELQDR